MRLHALVELLYATGLRVSELVALPRSAAALDGPTILVKGKGGRERLVPIGGPARAAMALHRALLAEAPAKSGTKGGTKATPEAPPGSFPPTARPAI